MIGKLLIAGLLMVAAASSVVVLARERQFTAGSPFTGIFSAAREAGGCDAAPPGQVIGISPTDLHIFEGTEWWRGRAVQYRAILLKAERPGFLIRAWTERGEAIALVVEPKREGFELANEEITLANKDRVKQPRRANNPDFQPCPAGTRAPWAPRSAATSGS